LNYLSRRVVAPGHPAAAAAVPLVLVTACAGGGNRSGNPSAAAAGPVASATGTASRPAAERVSLSETGSTLLFPLLRVWSAAFSRQYPQVSISASATGSGTGITDASAGTVNIGASDVYLPSGDVIKNPALLNVPLAVSAQQVNYNVPGLGARVHLKLNGEILAQMYEGGITAWNAPAIAALNPGVKLPDIKVVPLHRSDSSGDTYLFTGYLAAHDASWNSEISYGTAVAWPITNGPVAWAKNSGMVAGCKATPGCVAYVGISYLSQALADGLGEAQLQNAAGHYLLPTAASISAAGAAFASVTPLNETISMVDSPAPGGYPIINYEYAIVSMRQPSALKARDVRAFLRWAITAGNSLPYLTQVRFQPLPASVALLSSAQIAEIS
jgi:phosphate transport system substrate-binding protein